MLLSGMQLSPNINGKVTLNVLLDLLEPYELLHAPANRKRRISWVYRFLENPINAPLFDDAFVCYLCKSDDYAEAINRHDSSFILLFLEPQDADPDASLFANPSVNNRIVVIRKNEDSPSFDELLAHMTDVFFSLARLSERTDGIVRNGGSIQDLVDAGSPLFGNWVHAMDSTYNLIASTRDIDPPDDFTKHLVDIGCLDTSLLIKAFGNEVFKKWSTQEGIATIGPNDMFPIKTATFVIKENATYLGHVVMVANKRDLTPGIIDLFEAFANACKLVVLKNSNSSSKRHADGFLRHLLNDRNPRKEYIDNQVRALGIENMTSFCTIIIDGSRGAYAEQNMLLLQKAESQLTNSLIIPYGSYLLGLFYVTEIYSEITWKMADELEHFCEKYDCYACKSSIFTHIEDFAVSFEQAKVIRKIRTEEKELTGYRMIETNNSRVFLFSEIFCSMIDDAIDEDDDVIRFSYDNTTLDHMELMQSNSEVPDLKLLYWYLRNERRATPTSKKLHMHRNNVIYRIKAIETKLHISLDDYHTREYLRACYRVKIRKSDRIRKMLFEKAADE